MIPTKVTTILLSALLVFLLGMITAYTLWVPHLKQQLETVKANEQQREKDAKAEHDQKEKDYADNAKEADSRYRAVLARLRMLQQATPTDSTKPAVGDPSSAHGTLQEFGFDSSTMMVKGVPLAERLSRCADDSAKLTGLQTILMRDGVKISNP